MLIAETSRRLNALQPTALKDDNMSSIEDLIVTRYKALVEQRHASRTHAWPILTGHDRFLGVSGSYFVMVLRHTGKLSMSTNDIVDPKRMLYLAGGAPITDENKEEARNTIRQRMLLSQSDLVLLLKNNQPLPSEIAGSIALNISNSVIDYELQQALLQHELALGLAPMKIFLSHKGVDKALVREYKQTLQLLGFEPWLDEDAMPAGTSLERGILKGFDDSCAAVFFVTPNFTDERYLAAEVDYAIEQKRAKGERFSIITLVLAEDTKKGSVPRLLRPYVWKEPTNHLQGIREILHALPVRVGEVRWKQ